MHSWMGKMCRWYDNVKPCLHRTHTVSMPCSVASLSASKHWSVAFSLRCCFEYLCYLNIACDHCDVSCVVDRYWKHWAVSRWCQVQQHSVLHILLVLNFPKARGQKWWLCWQRTSPIPTQLKCWRNLHLKLSDISVRTLYVVQWSLWCFKYCTVYKVN